MPSESGNVHKMKGLSDEQFEAMVQYVSGLANISGGDLSQPILRPNLRDTYYLFIVQYAFLFIFGVVANIACVYYIFKNKLYRENSHAFFVNLCVCHFVQSAFVLPITLVILIVHNWILGQFMCYFVPMLQDIPLHAALLTHLLIAWDRMRWLSDPMNSRFPAFVCCCATWLTGMVIALPYPIYTFYLDLGIYTSKFQDVGICVVNLVDDSQEYTRGLFFLMYIAPSVILAYLYIRTSKDLHPPDSELSVMMYEQRAEFAAQRQQRRSTSSSRSGTSRQSYTRSYDLYDAEADAMREQRTQLILGTMAACEVICIGPLMVLRSTRDRIWRYFRLSGRRNDSDNKLETRRTIENSITQENTTETLDIDTSKASHTQKIGSAYGGSASKTLVKAAPSIYTTTNALKTNKYAQRSNLNRSAGSRNSRTNNLNRSERTQSITDDINISCSNITASTYCNGNGMSGSSGGLDFDNSTLGEDKSNCGGRDNTSIDLHRNEDAMHETENLSLRRESSSTYERDMDIIDLLQRERSMDLKETIERERRHDKVRKLSTTPVRTNSSAERHRKLPDINKIVPPINTKRSRSIEQSANFPNFVFTHQHNEFAEALNNRTRNFADASAAAFADNARTAIDCDRNDDEIGTTAKLDSRKSSVKSARNSRIQIEGHDAKHANNL